MDRRYNGHTAACRSNAAEVIVENLLHYYPQLLLVLARCLLWDNTGKIQIRTQSASHSCESVGQCS